MRNTRNSSLMMLIVIPAVMGITAIVVALGQVRMAELEVLMGAGCSEKTGLLAM